MELFPAQPSPAEARRAIRWGQAAVLVCAVSVTITVVAAGQTAPPTFLWGLATLSFLAFLAAIFTLARARVLSWDAAHPWPDDDDEWGGGRWPWPKPQPSGGVTVDWDRFTADLQRYSETQRQRERVGSSVR